MEELIGDATKSRLFATVIDHLLALGAMFLVVAQVPPEYPALKAFFFFTVYLAYYAVFEGAWSRTPGKFFQGLVVRKTDGSPCGWKAALIRSLARLVEVNPILFGGVPAGLVIIYSQRKQRIGDLLAGTVVVTTRTAYLFSQTRDAALEIEE
jgi:uncharacterized RDD family membrane protein YckC